MNKRFVLTPIAVLTLALGTSIAAAQPATGSNTATGSDNKATTQSGSGTTGGTSGYGASGSATTGSGTTGSGAASGTTGSGSASAPSGTRGSAQTGTGMTGSTATGTTAGSGTAASGARDSSAPTATMRGTGTGSASAQQNWERTHRASKIIGMDVVNRQGEKVGDVEDIVLDQKGNVAYAVVSTGGFLGIGERLHAVPWRSLQTDTGSDNFVLDVDKDRLRSAPGFDQNNFPDVNDPKWSSENRKFFPQAGATGSTGAAATGTQRSNSERGTTGATGTTGTGGTAK